MAYNWNAIEQQNLARLNQAQQPGLGQQFAQKAANKIATDQVAKLGLQAAGTAAAGPLGGAAGSVAGELAGPLASQLVGGLFNKGGPVYMQGGGSLLDYYLSGAFKQGLRDAAQARKSGGDPVAALAPAPKGVTRKVDPNTGFVIGEGKPVEVNEDAPGESTKEWVPVISPRAKSRAEWNIPLGEALGAEWSTQGHYADMDTGKDPWGAMLKGTWRFNEGGEVPTEKKEVGFWKGFKDKVVGDFERRKSLFGDGQLPQKQQPQYKNIGGYTKGPLGMSDMQVAGKPKDVSKVKIKKSKGDQSEEVELNYHPPLAAKPKPTGE